MTLFPEFPELSLVSAGTVLQERLRGFLGLGSFMSAAVTSALALSMDIPAYFVIFSVINDDEMVISWALSHRTFCR